MFGRDYEDGGIHYTGRGCCNEHKTELQFLRSQSGGPGASLSLENSKVGDMKRKENFGWTLKRPDGTLSYRYFRITQQEVREFFDDDLHPAIEAPDCETWTQAMRAGYRIVRVRLVDL